MSSPKRRNTSKSGGSRKSTREPAKSRGTENSSRTAEASSDQPATFEATFGRGESPEQGRYRALLAASEGRLQQLQLEKMPANALLRARHKQKIARERKLIRDLAELLD